MKENKANYTNMGTMTGNNVNMEMCYSLNDAYAEKWMKKWKNNFTKYKTGKKSLTPQKRAVMKNEEWHEKKWKRGKSLWRHRNGL